MYNFWFVHQHEQYIAEIKRSDEIISINFELCFLNVMQTMKIEALND